MLTAGHRDDPRVGGKGRGLARLMGCGAAVPPTVCLLPGEDDLGDALRHLGDPSGAARYAVRSSGAAEDGERRSFAGLFESFLRVSGLDSLQEAIARCRASGASERVLAYASEPQAVTVLLQPMVAADFAGVLFTCDPLSGSRNHLVLEGVAGTAEDLLAGTRGGFGVTLDRSGAPLSGAVPFDHRELVRQALAWEADLGGPLDLEWALEGDRLVWLQARPVTAAGTTEDAVPLAPGEVPRVAPGETHWTSQNAREALPGVAPPLAQDLCRSMVSGGFEAVTEMLGIRLDEAALVEFFQGRAFLNVTGLQGILRHLPLRNPEVLMDRILGLTPAEPPRPRLSLALLGRGLALGWRILTLARDYRRFVARERPWPEALETWTTPEILAEIDRLRDIREAFTLHGLGTGLYTTLYDAMEKLGASPGEFLQGLGRLRFGSSAAALRGLAAGESLEAFLEEYGHLGSGTIDFSVPTWRDRPDQVRLLVQGLVEAGEVQGREAYSERLRTRRRAAEAAARRRLPWPRFDLVRVALQWAAPYRENLKFHVHRRLAILRSLVLELGRRGPSGIPEDAFFRTFPELREGRGQELVAGRRAEHQRNLRRGYPLHRVGRRAYFPVWSEAREFRGTPASPGLFRGTARVLLDLAEASRLRPGDVLVTTSTDPSWTPLFSVAGAVVVEVGSALSHGAVVAREVGVPAVVGLPGVVSAVRDGEEVEVDGTRGVVLLA